MRLHFGRLAGAMAIGLLAAPLAGCLSYQAHVMSGDGDQVVIQYTGDVALTLPLARQHCAQYERVPQQRETDPGSVTYACVPPDRQPSSIRGDLHSKLTLITALLTP
jgi:hypothetical protein